MTRLNLLPPEIKKEIDYSNSNARLYQFLVRLIACGFFVLTAVFLIGYIVWSNQPNFLEVRYNTYQELTKMSQVEINSRDLYSRLILINKVRTDQFNWKKIMSEISSTLPSGVRITSYDFTNASTARVTISGFADTTSGVGLYRENLSKSKIFKYVDIESIVAAKDPADTKKTGFSFSLTMNLNLSEAKKK